MVVVVTDLPPIQRCLQPYATEILYISHLATFSIVLGISVKLSFSSFSMVLWVER